jgi:hypothetical protein
MEFSRHTDSHEQLRSLYMSLLTTQDHFDEFKHLLSMYPAPMSDQAEEGSDAAAVRDQLNQRIREWIGGTFTGLSSAQIHMWRSIVVDERVNVALSPWKESNTY